MEESSPLSILTSMNSWFTPTILFIFLNLMIATILFTSNLPNNNTQQNQNQNQKVAQNENNQNDLNQSKLTRSPSILHRLRSFNFHPHKSQQPPPLQELEQEPLEVAATEYVFSHPLFPHDQYPQPISQNPKSFDLDPTHVESDPTHVDLEPTHVDLEPTRFEKQPKLETHVYEEKNHTIERVITHFNFGPIHNEKSDPNHVESDPTRIENEDPVNLMDTHEEEKDELKSLDEIYGNITGGHVNRTKSDTLPASGEIPVKLPAKMKKSASMKSAFSHFEEEKIVEARRPETVRERRSAARTAAEGDVEVDARADDFINKFKHQLKLQRLDSLIRYKDMVNRGSEK